MLLEVQDNNEKTFLSKSKRAIPVNRSFTVHCSTAESSMA